MPPILQCIDLLVFQSELFYKISSFVTKQHINFMDSARIIIVGGGAIGLSTAYHLGAMGASEVLVLERHQLTSGTSWHAAGIIGPLRATLNLTRLASYAPELFKKLEAETGQSTGYQQTGGLWLTTSEERMAELRRIAAMGLYMKMKVEMLTPEEVKQHLPGTRTDDLAGGMWLEQDGQANPVDVCMAYAKAARSHGVKIREEAEVISVKRLKSGFDVSLAEGSSLQCEILVNCAGAWAPNLGRMIGVPAANQPVEHMYVVTEQTVLVPEPFPVTRDLESGIYIMGRGGSLVLGGFEPEAKVLDPRGSIISSPFVELPEDWEQFEPFMNAGLNRLPVFERLGIRHFMNGPESFTPDTLQLMGPVPGVPGYLIAAGFNSLGIVSSAGAGRAMAEWIVDGRPSFDLWGVNVARLDRHHSTPAVLRDRMQESVANLMAMHWPFKQLRTARGLKRTVLHDSLSKQGAVFGVMAGWERPLWFAQSEDEKKLVHTFGVQNWWPIAVREAECMTNSCAMFDLSPFSKFEIAGPGALQAMQMLSTKEMDLPLNKAVYTLMLNSHGGIEIEATVVRLEETRFRITTGAATREKDFAFLQEAIKGFSAGVVDVTSAEAVLALNGSESRTLLQSLSDTDLSAVAFPFAASREVDVGMTFARVTRLSYAGELGFEISCTVESAPKLYQSLLDADSETSMIHAGMFCLDGCRLEKNFVHWGHDIGTHDNPLEAGLEFAVDSGRFEIFTGGNILAMLNKSGIRRRRVLFELITEDGQTPLLLHDEPIYRGDRIVGLTTSGGLGPRTGLALTIGYVECEPGQTLSDLCDHSYRILVAGTHYDARPLLDAPYDPGGKLMRG